MGKRAIITALIVFTVIAIVTFSATMVFAISIIGLPGGGSGTSSYSGSYPIIASTTNSGWLTASSSFAVKDLTASTSILVATTSSLFPFSVEGSGLFNGTISGKDATITDNVIIGANQNGTTTIVNRVRIFDAKDKNLATSSPAFQGIGTTHASQDNNELFIYNTNAGANAGASFNLTVGADVGYLKLGLRGARFLKTNGSFQINEYENEPIRLLTGDNTQGSGNPTNYLKEVAIFNPNQTIGFGGTTTPAATVGIQGGLYVNGSTTIQGSLTLASASSSVVSLGTASSSFGNGLNITSGCFAVSGSCLQGGVPGGAANELQYNNGNVFGGTTGLTWNSANSQFLFGTTTQANGDLVKANANITISGTSTAGTLIATTTFTDTTRIGIWNMTKTSTANPASGLLVFVSDTGGETVRLGGNGQFSIATTTPAAGCKGISNVTGGFCNATSSVFGSNVLFDGPPTTTVRFNYGFIIANNGEASTTLSSTTIKANAIIQGTTTSANDLITTHIYGSGVTPVLSSCGTNPVIDPGANDISGFLTTGSGPVTSCTITFTAPWQRPPSCGAWNNTTPLAFQPSYSSTSVTFTNLAGFASNLLNYICIGTKLYN